MNPLKKIANLGQAIWLDDIHRSLMTRGRLRQLIEADGLRGLTSNPAIFKKAIADSADYEADIHELKQQGHPVTEVFEALAIKDVQMAADEFRPLYESTDGEHGYVSIEVNPHLAHYTAATVQEGRHLWEQVDRPNIFVKVPATLEGLPAITQLLSEGINVNVTLIFGLPRYREVANAFLAGVGKRLESGDSVARLRSVASFFLSRIDALLDPKFEAFMKDGGERAALGRQLRGTVALASAKTARQMYRELIATERWKRLASQGASPQWLLWASTSTKNPAYSDVKYIEPLIGPETINTMPMETLDAYRDHGKPQARLDHDFESARQQLALLPQLGIAIDEITQQLENEGIEKFCQPFDELLETLERELVTA
jgi:transaldolase